MGGDIELFSLFIEADFFVKFIIILLLGFSCISWGIAIEKYISLKIQTRKAKKFKEFFWSEKMINDLYIYYKRNNTSPYSDVFVSAIIEWELQTKDMGSSSGIRDRLKERIYDAMIVSKNRSLSKIGAKIPILANIASSAPFIGLLGTVWGVMNSFRSIANNDVVNISVVAPGIAEALLATAVGLFAAIPANIFYNYILTKFNSLDDDVSDFSLELLNVLTREFDK